jgi:limonene 1,2-monooxygenase
MVLLDHLTRGRVMLGVGPGALASDAYMFCIHPERQREMMDESLGVIMQLLDGSEPVTCTTDWFQLRDATLQLRPYQKPTLPVAVASVQSPAGVLLAGIYPTMSL